MNQRLWERPFREWGKKIYHYRWAVVVSWFFLLCILTPLALQITSLLKDNGFTPVGSPSYLGIEKLENGLGMSAATLEIVLESRTGQNLTTSEASMGIKRQLVTLENHPFVKDMYSQLATHLRGQDHIISYSVLLNESTEDALKHFEEIKAAVPKIEGVNTYITGNTAIYYDMNNAVKRDIVRAEMIGIPLALLILLFVFRTLPAAILPLLVGGSSVVITMGILYVVAMNFSLSNFVPNVVTMLGLAVGIDYALFIVSRFREELKEHSVEESLVITCGTAGRSVLISGIAVWVGLLAMNFVDLPIFRSLSIAGVTVVFISVLAANTLLPALLGILGHHIHSLPVSSKKSRVNKNNGRSTFWITISRYVMAHPRIIAISVTLLLVCTMIPTTHMKLGIPAAEVLPYSYESRYGAELMKQAYDMNEVNAIQIAVELPNDYSNLASVQDIRAYMKALRLMPNVRRVESYASLGGESKDAVAGLFSKPEIRAEIENRHVALGKMAVIAVVSEYGDTDERTVQLVKHIRSIQPDGMKVYVTGGPAYKLDIMERIEKGLPWVFLFVFTLMYIVLMVAFRSIILPLKAVIMNILSLGASLGMVVLVFQEGYGADWFHISSTGSVFAVLPVLLFCIVFGISMDYEVFMLSRMKEYYKRSGNNEHSTAEGLQHTGGIISSAALILIAVVGAFIFTDNEIMKAMGFGMTVAVLIDVTVIRILLVPALMKMLGKANWWGPAWLSKTPTSIKDKDMYD